ncbi:uncharacterized protein LOC116194323 [Punica granatum]|uniref:Uncharacterized protein LOC116194323 n=2 Tax=Punica granatum TaxID=22663 RepID=A0A6P8CD88_PUNGR|nr:uncharacterized protein LOC116194323 [Punica granatum]PKI52924.1 hypothetical protein CRG98_026755 [Punica granatum]
MAYYYNQRRSPTAAAISDGFTLSPLPWPVLVILAVAFVFLGTSWYFSLESAVETAEEEMGWLLLATPVVLLLLVQWLSSIESPDSFLGWDRRRRSHHWMPPSSEGGSPWGVAALIVLLLVLVQYQSSFLESWFV